MKDNFWTDPHVVRARKSFLRAFSATVVVFISWFVVSHIGGSLYISSLAKNADDSFNAGIATDIKYLKDEGDKMATSSDVIEALVANDAAKLISLIKKAAESTKIEIISVANKNGVTMGRTRALGIQSDNVFLTIPEGQVVSTGKSVENIGQGVLDPTQIKISTGRPISYEGNMIGGLFTTVMMDNAYAAKFKNTYLPTGVEVVFYTKEYGVYGDSFDNPDTEKLVKSYFNSGSDWIQNMESGKTVAFGNGRYYLVENKPFTNINNEIPGGALIFIPRNDISTMANLGAAITTLLVFIFFALWYHYHSRGEVRGGRYWIMFTIASAFVLGSALTIFYAENSGFVALEHIPYTIYNSTLRFQPEFGIYDQGFEQRFSMIADTGDEAINAVTLSVVFDPLLVEAKKIDTDSSVCSYLLENKIDNKIGRATMSCIITNPKVGRGTLALGDIVMLPKTKGTFTLAFDNEETKILANDGLGTNVLRMSQSGSYRVDDFDSTLLGVAAKTKSEPKEARSFVVFSPTHPNQSRWYNSDTARFLWKGKPDAVYAYEFDASLNTVPTRSHTTKNNSVDLTIPGDGIYYFHLQLLSGGPIAHYRIQADKTPPSIFGIHLSSDKVYAGDVVRFTFEGGDISSGIQHNYYVDLGNHLFLPVGTELFIPFIEAGDQNLTLRIYDNAGNYSEKSEIIHVEATP